MDTSIVLGKLAIAVLAAMVCVLGMHRKVQGLPWRSYLRASSAYLVVSRLVVFVGLYVILREHAQSDVPASYYPQAKAAIHGMLPYKDFPTPYGPLFPYVASLPVRALDSPLSIVALAILFEIAAFPLWVALARRTVDQNTAKLAILLYVTSPIALVNVAIDGQNQVWTCCFLAAALLVCVNGRPLASGLNLGLPLVLVKLLAAVVAPAFLIRGTHRWAFLAGFVAIPLVTYLAFVLLGASPWGQVTFQASDHTSGNFPFLLSTFVSHPSSVAFSRAADALTLVGMAGVYTLAWWKTRFSGRDDYQTLLVVLFMLTFLLFSKKSYTNYIVLFLFPLCIAVAGSAARRRSIFLFFLLGLLAVLEPTLWFRWLSEHDLRGAWEASSGRSQHARVLAFAICDLALIGLYLYYCREAWGLVSSGRRTQQKTTVEAERRHAARSALPHA